MKNNFNNIKILRNELVGVQKPIHNLTEIKKWYFRIVKNSNVKVVKIDLSKCSNWSFSKKNISHKSNKFFKIEGLRVVKSFNREVKEGWDQPILTEPNFKGGILGLMRKKINGTPHYLVNAKFEPGNYKLIQISPTLQATFSNISRAHKGRKPKYLNYFVSPEKNNCKILFKQWMSEEGGRLNYKRNLGILINNTSTKELEIGNDFMWITLRQIKELILENAIINPHLRGMVSFI